MVFAILNEMYPCVPSRPPPAPGRVNSILAYGNWQDAVFGKKWQDVVRMNEL